MTCLRINLWSGPRNVSTALMYAFAQRNDTRVVDEPLYGHYLKLTGVKHPGDREVIEHMDCDGNRVIREVILGDCDRPVLFMKNMAHHLIEVDRSFLSQTCSVFLIRDPREMLPSLVHQIPEPTLRDAAYKTQYDLFHDLKALGQDPPVLDARELLLHPKGVLEELCRRIDIPFEAGMLRWPAGPRPEDGIWAKHWYHNVHKSTGFQKYQPKTEPFPERLQPLLAECQPYYATLYREAIKTEANPDRV